MLLGVVLERQLEHQQVYPGQLLCADFLDESAKYSHLVLPYTLSYEVQ
jgi:hypothetical protein